MSNFSQLIFDKEAKNHTLDNSKDTVMAHVHLKK